MRSTSIGQLDIGGALQCVRRERDRSVLVCPCMREWTVSSHSSASTSYSCLSLPLSLRLSFFLPASLSPVHLSLLDSSHYCLGTSSACPAKARHWNGIWERGSVWEIVNEEREEGADREREREMRSRKKRDLNEWKGKKDKGTGSGVREQRMLQHN